MWGSCALTATLLSESNNLPRAKTAVISHYYAFRVKRRLQTYVYEICFEKMKSLTSKIEGTSAFPLISTTTGGRKQTAVHTEGGSAGRTFKLYRLIIKKLQGLSEK